MKGRRPLGEWSPRLRKQPKVASVTQRGMPEGQLVETAHHAGDVRDAPDSAAGAAGARLGVGPPDDAGHEVAGAHGAAGRSSRRAPATRGRAPAVRSRAGPSHTRRARSPGRCRRCRAPDLDEPLAVLARLGSSISVSCAPPAAPGVAVITRMVQQVGRRPGGSSRRGRAPWRAALAGCGPRREARRSPRVMRAAGGHAPVTPPRAC
jgi:hypothetical protein